MTHLYLSTAPTAKGNKYRKEHHWLYEHLLPGYLISQADVGPQLLSQDNLYVCGESSHLAVLLMVMSSFCESASFIVKYVLQSLSPRCPDCP